MPMKQPLETFISKWVEIAHMHRPPLQKLNDAKLTTTQHLCVAYMNFQRNPNNFFFPSHHLCHFMSQCDLTWLHLWS
jgi:hypothetical protein